MTAEQKNLVSIIAAIGLAAVLVLGLNVNLFGWIDAVTERRVTDDIQTTATTTATVTRVIDGDTFAIDSDATSSESVRLIGVDAPEIDWEVSSQPAAECFGFLARDFLKGQIEGMQVQLVGDSQQPARDDYDRRLAYVYIDDKLVNEALLAAGMARELTVGAGYDMRDDFQAIEATARSEAVGLWDSCVNEG